MQFGYIILEEIFKNEIYLKLLETLGPEQSHVLIEKLTIDLKDTRRGLKAAQSAKTNELLIEPSHVLISLAGVLGAHELHTHARLINDQASQYKAEFPKESVDASIGYINAWLAFLKSDSLERGK
jgi:hypothetical protein